MTLIFVFSHQDGTKSQKLSGDIANSVKSYVTVPSGIVDDSVVKNYLDNDYILRKAAHFTEYFILALLIHMALALGRVRNIRSLAFTLVMCVAYAVSDEIHQAFVAGRSPMVLDVAIDTAGAALALGTLYLRRKFHRKLKDLSVSFRR